MIIGWGTEIMTNTFRYVSPARVQFSNECLSLYKDLSINESRDTLFHNCVQDRLNELLEANSVKLDELLKQLEQFTLTAVVEDPPFIRCENYTRMVKTKNKNNVKYIKKLFKTYNKACIMSTTVLHRLLKVL
jgi:hypothetical protein